MNALILVVIAIINLVLGCKARFDDGFRENYVKNSHKAWIWRKMFGEEKASSIVKNLSLIPIVFGIVILTFVAYRYLFT